MARQLRAERTREALLEAAAAEFARHGFERARINDMLDRSGTTKGALYHHFTTKQEMADELLALDSRRWPALMDEVAASETRGLNALHELVTAIARTIHGDARALAVLRIVEDLDAEDRFVFDLWQNAVARTLQQAIADGEVSDDIPLLALSTMLADCIYGVCLSPAPWSGPANVVTRVEQLWAVILSGLRRR